jgi:hypothetical protein
MRGIVVFQFDLAGCKVEVLLGDKPHCVTLVPPSPGLKPLVLHMDTKEELQVWSWPACQGVCACVWRQCHVVP